MLTGALTIGAAGAFLALAPTFDGSLLKSALVAVGGAGAAWGGWRLRALAVEKANADALERRVQVLEMELQHAKDAGHEAELQVRQLEGEIKVLQARPDLTGVAGVQEEQAALLHQLVDGLARTQELQQGLQEALAVQGENIVGALQALTRRIGVS